MTQPLDLRKDKPHPMPSLLAVVQFPADVVKTEILGIDKPLQVKRIASIIHIKEVLSELAILLGL
jgi:hypothetical protein